MKIVHLIQYHLGGGRKRKGGKGGHTPTPQLPNAGKPYVDSVSYDKDAKKVRLRAQNARAGEVKTPLGDWQEFPVDVPEPTPLPDAGKPFVESVTYDPDTKKVKVRAKVAQAGEVKTPEGDLQEFPIHVPTPPAPPAPTLPDAGKPRVSKFDYDPATRKVTVQASVVQAGEVKTPTGDEQTFDIPAEETPAVKGIVYMYRMTNHGIDEEVWTDVDAAESVTVNGETYYTHGSTSFELPEGGFDNMQSVICSSVKPMPATGIEYAEYVPLNAHRPERLNYEKEAYVSVSSEGYIVITRNVTVS